jgi:FAD/FMN-containing dehydrogenase
MAMDFAVPTSQRKRAALWSMCQRLADVVLDAGGRFYYAKDALLPQPAFERVHGSEAVRTFRSLKERCDPRGMLQTDLSRRLMG